MPRRTKIVAAGIGATLVGLLVMAVAVRQRSTQVTDRRPITTESIVMLGDSITEQGPWESHFADRAVVNQGYSGYTTAQLVPVAESVAASRPRAVYILSGTNDIRDGRSAAWTVRNLGALVDTLNATSPETTVVIQNLLPRSDHPDEVRRTNWAIEEFALDRGIDLVDLYSAFDDGNGALMTQDTVDGLHLSSAGNQRWADLLAAEFAARP